MTKSGHDSCVFQLEHLNLQFVISRIIQNYPQAIMKSLLVAALCLLVGGLSQIPDAAAQRQPEFSTAGFYEVPGTGRTVFSMNPVWRFHKGAVNGAERSDFDDSAWDVVSLPNGIEYLPTEASGCINYQGEVWYRKHFTPADSLRGKQLSLHFEAIMGKSRVYVNGTLLAEHYGGYLPVIVDVTKAIRWGADNVIAVMADNSNDPSYPPGKPQETLDYTYFGGIYRDCWLISHNKVFITDPNVEQVKAGGGLFVAYDKVSAEKADVLLKTHLRNVGATSFRGTVEYEFFEPEGQRVAVTSDAVHLGSGAVESSTKRITLRQPQLWSPESPALYDLYVRILDKKGHVIDGYRRRIGIRSVEFKGKDGFWLNGQPYGAPLIGANRHQDYGVIGNAVPNSLHWRDAKKLRDAGLKVIRNAHCPQDPAFMDACDELGLFVIDNIPGWQFWNEAPIFAQRVFDDTRQLVRRDRNHPSVWLWEPILNETWYPADFARQTQEIVKEEYPFPYCYTACDAQARGHETYPVLFSHPTAGEKADAIGKMDPKLTYFTREWGDNVDDWNSHNSPSRVARNWGEMPMLIQAQHYAKPDYDFTCYDVLCRTPRQHVGGCLWHAFDHQRGYHPDPFYGGLMDVFRQPKYAYQMFKAQRPPHKENKPFETGPMVYIAHEMTPFSPADVTVYSNCDEVRLTFNRDGKTYTYNKSGDSTGMPSPIITFPGVFDFMTCKNLSMYHDRQADVFLRAEGLMDGKVVATHEVRPARRPSKLLLWVDDEGQGLTADGSDIVTLVAAVADADGNIKRLNNYHIAFSVEGEGCLLGDASILANPTPVKWGTAPVLLQSTLRPGPVRVTASVLFEGTQMPVSAVLELTTRPVARPAIYNDREAAQAPAVATNVYGRPTAKSKADLDREQAARKRSDQQLKEVEQQQADFGEQKR